MKQTSLRSAVYSKAVRRPLEEHILTMRYRAVLFDFDLTLADSREGVIDCVNHALARLGLPVASPQRIGESIGLSMPATLAYVADRTDPVMAERFNRYFIERADQVMADLTHLYPPVQSVLRTIHEAGLALGIVSSKLRYRIEGILARDGLDTIVSVIVGGGETAYPKPHPAGLHLALARLRCAASDAVYVGDHAVDGAAAQQAGVAFVGVLTGYAEPKSFSPYTPLAVLDHLGMLPAVLNGR